MRKTKIIATIGPASSDPSVFSAMCRAGVNVARLNFSHGTHEEQLAKIRMIQKVREELDLPIAIMLDTKGPEYRTGTFKTGKVHINDGDLFTFTTRDVEGDGTIVSVSYKNLAKELQPGDTILVNNGLVSFRVLAIGGQDIRCQAIIGGDLSDHKSMSFPNKVLKQTYLSEQDKKDLLLGIENHVDFIAASFVSCKQDILDLKAFLSAHGGGSIDIIAKIENRAGVDNIEDICGVCEGIMVARGALGVANAVYDGTSAIMLSGETAAGKYPVQAVETMAAIAEETEQHIHYETRFRNNKFQIRSLLDAISHATCGMAIDIGAKAIVVSSISGRTVRMVSRFRVPTDIVGMATSRAVWYKLALSWGVQPVLCEHFESTDVLFYHARKAAKQALHLAPGDRIILTGGTVNGTSGNTNLIRVDTIQ